MNTHAQFSADNTAVRRILLSADCKRRTLERYVSHPATGLYKSLMISYYILLCNKEDQHELLLLAQS